MPRYFMRDTPLQAMEQLMMSQPGQKPRGGGIYRSPFHYTPKDVACKYCQNYDRKHSCRLYECTCLGERIEAGVLELNEFVRDCFALSMGPQLRKRMEEKKNLCAPIPLSLHQRLRTEQEQRGQTLSDYITDILREHFEGGARTMNANNRTIAFQVPEELFGRLKDYLARNGLKQKDFILGLIERELNDAGSEE